MVGGEEFGRLGVGELERVGVEDLSMQTTQKTRQSWGEEGVMGKAVLPVNPTGRRRYDFAGWVQWHGE